MLTSLATVLFGLLMPAALLLSTIEFFMFGVSLLQGSWQDPFDVPTFS